MSVLDNRNLLRYYGSGTKRAWWIVPLMQAVPHRGFCSPFLGGANVEIHKPPVHLEVVGDINGRVVNFMRVLRSHTRTLAEQLALTPYADAEFEQAKEISPNAIEDARRFFLLCWGSMNGGPTGRSFRGGSLNRGATPADDINNKEELLYAAARRIKHWIIYQKDYRYVLKRVAGLANSSEILIYLDPPFLTETRDTRSKYPNEFTESDHADMLKLVYPLGLAQPIFISGYAFHQDGTPVDVYDLLYGWTRHDQTLGTNSGGKRVESLWVSPYAQQYLDKIERWNSGRGVVDPTDYSGLFEVAR